MVAELPGSGTLAAIMLLQMIGTAMAIAVVEGLVCAWMQMRPQEEVVEYVETLRDLQCHRKACAHLKMHVIAGNPGVKDYEPCQDCFLEKYTHQELRRRHVKCYGMARGIVLLIGFALGSLATLCGMIVSPGR